MYYHSNVMPKPCGECPFRKNAPRGWLGPWNPTSILQQAFSEFGLACHMTADNPDAISMCAGSIICANKSAKKYRNTKLAQLQQGLGEDDNVLTAFEFIKHHKSGKE